MPFISDSAARIMLSAMQSPSRPQVAPVAVSRTTVKPRIARAAARPHSGRR